jgi:mannobiose 2-epimerase
LIFRDIVFSLLGQVMLGKLLKGYCFTRGSRNHQRPTWLSDDETLSKARTMVERILTTNIVPFWYPNVVDNNEGGYRLNHGLDGTWRGPANKCLVTQARTLWFFSQLANSPYGAPEHLKAARHGYEFLRDKMSDKAFGGFYWEVDFEGRAAAISEKRMYGQAFGLYALAEYAIASHDSRLKKWPWNSLS